MKAPKKAIALALVFHLTSATRLALQLLSDLQQNPSLQATVVTCGAAISACQKGICWEGGDLGEGTQ